MILAPKASNGIKSSMSTATKSMIPFIEFQQITASKSSPGTIAALLNEAEWKLSYLLRTPHKNAKRVYPFWKTCKVCSQPFPCHTKEQAARNMACSKACKTAILSAQRRRVTKPMEERQMALIECAVCGKEKWMPLAWRRRV